MIKKWYFVINDAGVDGYEYMIKAAVLSALKHTNLIPHCIYYGKDTDILIWLHENKVIVIRHSSSFLQEINDTSDNENWKKAIARGAYLKLDIPLVEVDDEFVLYTDCDVLFTQNFSIPTDRPAYFSAAPENDIGNWYFANTGVMVINVPSMRNQMIRVHEDVRGRLNALWVHGFGTYDQGVLNEAFKGSWTRLDPVYNWKPYWGINPNANIIHYHGPKPNYIANLIVGSRCDAIPVEYKSLFLDSPNSMSYYLGMFDQFYTRSFDRMYSGYVDEISVCENNLVVRGWLCNDGEPVYEHLKVHLNGSLVGFVHFENINRNDVADDLKVPDPMLGYEFYVDIKEFQFPIELKVFTNDHKFQLLSSSGCELIIKKSL